MENIHIRKAKKKDCPQVFAMIKTLAKFEKHPNAVKITAKKLELEGFGKNPWFELIVAEKGKKLIGFALWYPTYSTWNGKSLFLHELFIKKEFRGQGIGTILFERFIQEGKKKNVDRLEWQVMKWNAPAIKLYKQYGAKVFFDRAWCELYKEKFN